MAEREKPLPKEDLGARKAFADLARREAAAAHGMGEKVDGSVDGSKVLNFRAIAGVVALKPGDSVTEGLYRVRQG